MDDEKTTLKELIHRYWELVGKVYSLTNRQAWTSRVGNWPLMRESHLELTEVLDEMDTLAIEYETRTGKSTENLLSIVERMIAV